MNEHKTPVKEKSNRKLNFIKHKKKFIGGGLVVAIAIAGILSGIIIFQQTQQEEIVFVVGIGGGLYYTDTLEYFYPDTESSFIIDQIAEGLLDIKVTTNGTIIIPNLAEDWEWNPNATELTCFLQRGIEFHDGTQFNATAVKWNFDRINRTLNEMGYPWVWLDEGIRILNETKVIDDYTVKFVLNKPYIPFEAVLCCSMAYILSPSSTPADDFLDVEVGPVGTGPFIYESSPRIYDPFTLPPFNFVNIETSLVANPNYWGGPPHFDRIVCEVYDNDTLRREAMLSGRIDWTQLEPFVPENYTSVPGFSVKTYSSRDMWYITMNNTYINTTMRKAISYALDYDELLSIQEPRYTGGVQRTRSPLSKGMLYSNWSAFDLPYYNITKARQVLLDANWLGTAGLTADSNVSVGNDWEIIANSSTPLASYNMSYIITSPWRAEIANTFNENLKQIGINVEPIGVTWFEWYPENPISQFFFLAWGPDIIDPSNSINPLFSNKIDGYSNINNVNDTLIQQWMEEGIIETNKTKREELYCNIQKRIIEEIFPCIWYYTPVASTVHPDHLGDIDYLTSTYKFYVKDFSFK